MRRVPLFLLMLLPFTTLASAQTLRQFNLVHPMAIAGATAVAPVSPEIVVARLMTFDRDSNGRLTKTELPERMQNLLNADVSGDGALDSAEIRALARPEPAVAVAATIPGQRGFNGGGGYTFGDQVSLSTRSHVEGALDDLMLPASTRNRALAVITPFMDRLEADASAALLKEVEGLMAPQHLSSFKSAIDRQMSRTNGPAPMMTIRPDGSKASFFFRRGPDPAMLINAFGLPAAHASAAQAAFEGFKARIRPGDADRAALLDELKDVLDDDERENFGAALQRRPLVKAGVVPGVVSGVADVLKGIVEERAVFRMSAPPEPQILTP